MGWESNNVFQVLIITGSTGSGVFVYSPSPAFGKLVASVTAGTGTDIYGNAYLAGVTAYAPSIATAVSLSTGAVAFFGAPSEAGPWTAGGTIADELWAEPSGLIQLRIGAGLAQAVVSSTGLLVQGAAAAGDVLQVINSTATPTAPNLEVISQAAGDNTIGLHVAGDTNSRLRIDSNGLINWGSGAAALDTSLSRTGVGQLSSGQLLLSAALAGGDVLKVTNTTSAPTGASAHLIANAAADRLLGLQVAADTVVRLLVDSNGKHQWGPGGAGALDTDLFRGALGVLQTDSTFAITNQAAPATLAGAAQLYATAGQPAYKNPAGLTVNLSGANLATVNINTVTATTFTNLTNATIPAADAEVGATYKLTAFGNGTWGSTQQQLTLAARFGAAATNTVGSTPAITNTALAASAAFQWSATVTAVCVTTGVTGTWSVSITGCVTETANPLLPGTAANNTIPFASGTGSTDITLDTTIAEILGISALWASATGAPTISKHISYFERIA